MSSTSARRLFGRNIPVPLILSFLMAGGAALHTWMFATGRLAFDADQAYPGISALRILREGRIYPLGVGQHYNADLFSYYLAPLHLIFKPSVALLRRGMISFKLLFLSAMFLAVRSLFRSPAAGLAAAAMAAFPPAMIEDFLFRTAANDLIVITAFLLSVPHMQRTLETIEERGWDRPALWRSGGAGLLLGVAYFMTVGEGARFEKLLRQKGASFEKFACGDYRVYYNIDPDALSGVNREDIMKLPA